VLGVIIAGLWMVLIRAYPKQVIYVCIVVMSKYFTLLLLLLWSLVCVTKSNTRCVYVCVCVCFDGSYYPSCVCHVDDCYWQIVLWFHPFRHRHNSCM